MYSVILCVTIDLIHGICNYSDHVHVDTCTYIKTTKTLKSVTYVQDWGREGGEEGEEGCSACPPRHEHRELHSPAADTSYRYMYHMYVYRSMLGM